MPHSSITLNSASFLASQGPADQWRASAFLSTANPYLAVLFSMQERHITIPKTARYYTLGAVSHNTNDVWVACHGYAQLADDFIKEFEPLASSNTMIVAPEALSRFYTKGFFGAVGATWMTKEDRLNEIKDYVNYLEALFQTIKSEIPPQAHIHLLGYSQGCSTICRWIAEKSPAVASLWLCSGSIPDDLDFGKFKTAIEKSPAYYLIGNADPFIGEKDVQAFEEKIKAHQLPLSVHRFEGAHTLNVALIQRLAGKG